jgi:hypothetical protein
LPDKYRFLLFDDKREVELVWNGKTSAVCNVVLPFQIIEQVREERRKGRVASIRRTVALGDEAAVEEVLRASVCSRTINTSLVERRHATDRGRERTEVAADVPVQQGLVGA